MKQGHLQLIGDDALGLQPAFHAKTFIGNSEQAGVGDRAVHLCKSGLKSYGLEQGVRNSMNAPSSGSGVVPRYRFVLGLRP